MLEAKTTFNPIYMGAEVDYKGDALELGIGEQGQVANKVMLEHHKQFTPPSAIRFVMASTRP